MDATVIDGLFEEYADNTPGCAVAVVHRGDTLARGYGSADLERDTPITASTRFNLGSAAKQFTALAILLLESDGRLSRDDEVRTHLPWIHDFGTPVTLRHLIHHTSGLRDTYPDLLVLSGWGFSDLTTQDDCLRLLRSQRELSFPTGSEHLYVNANYVLLAEVVAEVAGTSLGSFLSERVFEPLGMGDTLVMDDVAAVMPGRALGYYGDGSGAWFNLPLNDSVVGSTNVYSTADDLVRWLGGFGDPRVAGPEVWEALAEPGTLDDGTPLVYAGGLEVGTYRGRPVIEHGGQHGGYCAWVAWFPDDDLAVAVLLNHFVGLARDQLLSVADRFLPEGGADPVAPPVEERRVAADAGRLEELAGTFFDERRAALRTIPLTDGSLHFMGLPLVPIGDDRFTFAEDPSVTVGFAGDGVTVNTPSGAYRYRRMPPFDPAAAPVADYIGRYDSPELGVCWRIGADDDGLLAHRQKHSDTRLTPVFADGLLDDWLPVFGFPFEFLLQFDRDSDGAVSGFNLSGQRSRGIRFVRTT